MNGGEAPAPGSPANLEPGMPTQEGPCYFRARKGKKWPTEAASTGVRGLLLGHIFLGSLHPHMGAVLCSPRL